MRISDWSSDVCSSDLRAARGCRPRRCCRPPVPGPRARSAGPPAAAPPRQQRNGVAIGRVFACALLPLQFGIGADNVAAVHVLDHLPLRQVLLLRSEEHTSELQSLMRTSYAVSFLKTKN